MTDGARILIADDEDSLRWVLEKGLRQAGYDVTAVADGDSALRAFAESAFDLVFLDIRMPGMRMSRKTRSNGDSAKARSALSPSLTEVTS